MSQLTATTATPRQEASKAADSRHIETIDPADVRPWRYHNRTGSGMDEASLGDLTNSILREGQQQPGLARRLPSGDTHQVEAIFGVRRLEACRRAGVRWRAEVVEESVSDAWCAAQMHSENEWTERVSPLENALQWKPMLAAGVVPNQAALARALG
ncbi:MAG: ParB/RepB/Spo0J family partition protein, partial [Gammaproteobacteria bacterium]|nr:ParB/RepB/Spo0J family partition protein [Gammaproteobacteria bacterium]